MTYEIRMAGDDDFFGWLPLFEGYCRFYETELDDAKALIVWNWIRDDADSLQAALAVDEEGRPIGLAQFVRHGCRRHRPERPARAETHQASIS